MGMSAEQSKEFGRRAAVAASVGVKTPFAGMNGEFKAHGQDVSADKTDGIIYMVVNLADRTGYGLRIISAPPLNTLKLSRLLKATGLRTGNIEFTSFETARSNSEIDIGPLDVFICCSADAMDRIIDCINARNIFLIAPEQISQAASSDFLKKLLQQITQVITSLQSGGHHVRP